MKSNILSSEPIAISEGTTPALTPRQFTRLCMSGKIVDGRAGGLILGKTLEMGGIIPIFKLGIRYIVQGRIETDSFAVNWRAATQNLSRLKAMNSGLTLRENVPPTEGDPAVSHFLITHGTPDDRLLYLHWSQVLVNPEATAKHLAELVDMNVWPNPYLECDLKAVLGWDGTEDGVV